MLLKNRNIFIVEDNPGNLAVTSFYLERQGAKIHSDRWGTNTANLLREIMPVDAILMDLMFPNNVSGFDIFEQIHYIPELAHIPIIAVSASDPDTAMPRAVAMGFAGFISKPISYLIAVHVADIIAGKRVWDV